MSVRGESGWKATYQKSFGKDRWPALSKALKAPVAHVAFVNPFLSDEAQAQFRAEHRLTDHESIPGVCVIPEGAAADVDEDGVTVMQAEILEEGRVVPMLPCYYLDAASVLAALALAVVPGERVLDLCAAPGGKSLVLASALFAPRPAAEAAPAPAEGAEVAKPEVAKAAPFNPEKWAMPAVSPNLRGPAFVGAPHKAGPVIPAGGLLVCNEASRSRAQRLQRVLSSFLPSELMGLPSAGGRVAVTISDATPQAPPLEVSRLGPFDKVLVDAPCTSDRHLARQGTPALSKWAAGAVKANAERQLELLKCAARLVRPGGTVLYCTCALSELENDGVVTKFLKYSKAAGRDFEMLPPGGELPEGADATATGTLILPDRTVHGPIFFAQLRRL